jgi:heme/copper-type cytochrome/quinol oxidase subunit 4
MKPLGEVELARKAQDNRDGTGARRAGLSTPTIVWLVLMAATVISCLSMAEGWAHPNLAVGVVVMLSALKARLIFIYFMELEWDMQPTRLLFELWVALVSVLLIAGNWMPEIAAYLRQALQAS